MSRIDIDLHETDTENSDLALTVGGAVTRASANSLPELSLPPTASSTYIPAPSIEQRPQCLECFRTPLIAANRSEL